MNPVKSIRKPPLSRFGGRPPKFTFEARTVLLDALRAGKAYASACLAAGITPVTLFSHRRADSRFDAQCRAARTTGKKLPQGMPGQVTMIDSNGNIVPNSEVVADEKERARLIRLRENLHGLTRSGAASQSRKRLSRRRENCHDEVVKRLVKLREEYENRSIASSSIPLKAQEVITDTAHSHNVDQIVPVQLPGAPPARPKLPMVP